MKARYLVLGLLLIGIALVAVPDAMLAQDGQCGITPSGVGGPHVWDRSSLYFRGTCSSSDGQVRATVCNGADSGAKLCETEWALYYAASGNPKRGTIVASGSVPPLAPGECYDITVVTRVPGNYMFWAEQAEGHPGQGELWSEACTIAGANGSPRGNRR